MRALVEAGDRPQLASRGKLSLKLTAFFLSMLGLSVLAVSWGILERVEEGLIEREAAALEALRVSRQRAVERRFDVVLAQLGTSASSATIADATVAFADAVGRLSREDPTESEAAYDQVHRRHHPRLRDYLESSGYHDILLFDLEGSLVYTLTGEVDLGTGFDAEAGWASPLGVLYRQASMGREGEVFAADLSPGEGGAGTTASWFAAPVFREELRVGVVAFRVPLDEINAITGDPAGLGESGETYLAGADGLMRTASRFGEAASVLKTRAGPRAVELARSGESGVVRQIGHRGFEVVSSFAPLRVRGLDWIIVAELDVAEVTAPARTLRWRIVLTALAIFVLVGIACMVFLRVVVSRPVARLFQAVERVRGGDYGARVDLGTGDELAEFASALNEMTESIEADIINRNRDQLQLQLLHSELEARQEALREAKEEYSRLVDAATDVIWSCDTRGIVTFLNPAIEDHLGLPREELIGKPFTAFIDPGSLERATADLLAVRDGAEVIDHEVVLRAADGTAKDVSYSSRPMRDQEGQIIGVQGLMRDISARKRAENKLRQTVEQFRAILNSALDAVVVIDAETVVSGCNPEAETLFGWPEDELTGRSLADTALVPEFRDEILGAVATFLETGDSPLLGRRLERRLRHRDGREFPAEVSFVPFNLGHRWQFCGFARDISHEIEARRALERAREAAEEMAHARSQFLANMSHEIRTPMNGVMGMLEMVLDTKLSAEQRESVEVALSSAEALLGILNDILDISKMDAGHLELEKIPFDLAQTLSGAMRLMVVAAARNDNELQLDFSQDVPEIVIGDPGRLRQVITNLLSNAIKFTQKGEVVLAVKVEDRGGDRERIRFSVRDTGCGIARDKLERIFEDFTQADSSVTRTHGGTGLGLTISRNIVAAMGGELRVESELGRGSEFYFTVELRRPTAPFEMKRGQHHGAIDFSGRRFLVVDDNPTARRIVRRAIVSVGGEVEEVTDAEAALESLCIAVRAATPYDAAVIDGAMPGRDGFSLARQVQTDPELSGTRLMMLSSVAAAEGREEARRLGVKAYLTKPVSRRDLLEGIRALLGLRGPGEGVERRMVTEETVISQRRHLRVLLAEDNKVNQRIAVAMLQKRGHVVDVVENGRDAVERAARGLYDLVLMDIQMPMMDGLEATRTLRAASSSADLPIIALTAHALEEERERCIEAGVDGFLAKPFKSAALFETIEEVLNGPGSGRAHPMMSSEEAPDPPTRVPASHS